METCRGFCLLVYQHHFRLVVFASSLLINAYDIIITISPFCTSRAAAPLAGRSRRCRARREWCRFQARAVVVVHNLHFFVHTNAGRIEQILIDGDAADIV